MSQRLSYASTGVDIDQTDAAKRAMAASMETADPRVLNRIGAFATLLDARFPGYAYPVLVHKSEEPGSKQKLAFAHGRHRGVCYDMVNHLIDDIIVMGAVPISIQVVIVFVTMDGA
ncbi:MAG: phosphoribosylformylglycinamidine cyclo-ligase, partial [Gemmatimonadetes bacterium]|nr:phosphoribosylformylglycinamidine cyclo-ligase [Gemmatimonadota bacterium]